MTMPEGAQRSEDGNYWWDGTQWQLVPDDQRGQSPTTATDSSTGSSDSPAPPQMTEDLVANMMNSAEQDAAEA
jgi:hypothetical protein